MGGGFPLPAQKLPRKIDIIRDVERTLVSTLPTGWSLETQHQIRAGRGQLDLLLEVYAPNGERAELVVEAKTKVEPRLVPQMIERLAMYCSDDLSDAVPVVAAAYLSPRSRQMLDDAGVGYIDLTGNIRIEASQPGLFVSAAGADRDPWPQDSDLQSLRGRGTARAVRAIVDYTPPFGVRELSAATGASAPTISRVLDLLDREGIITREPRGPVQAVDWQAAISRWAVDYSQTGSNLASTFLEPRGLPVIKEKLAEGGAEYAATGAFAAQQFNPIAPARTATLYVENAQMAASQLELREAEAGANVVLLEPFDPVVFDRTLRPEGLRCVAPSQLCVDLLTGPGREPSQGEEMLRWMERNLDVWRS